MKMLLPPSKIKPLHSVTHPSHVNELVENMIEKGWQGFPLLVVEAKTGEFYAWTGTHRLAAAISAELETVPCHLIHDKNFPGEVSAHWGHVDDIDRLKALRHAGEDEAFRLMWVEGSK